MLAGAAYPTGTAPGAGAWFPPQTAGEMALRSLSLGGLSASLLPTRAMVVALSGSSAFSASAALAVSMLLALAGAGALTATIQGRLAASVDLDGSGNLVAALGAIADMDLDLTGSGDLDALVSAFGDMTIDIVVTGTGLSTANVGQAVWAALSAANDVPGTMGAKLNAAASAGDPWTTDLPGTYPAGSAGYIIGNIEGITPELSTAILELFKLQGLDPAAPLVVTQTSRVAGAVEQTVVEAGGTVTVTRI